MTEQPRFVADLFILLTGALFSLLLMGLTGRSKAAGWSMAARRRLVGGAAAVIGGWLTAVGLLAGSGFFLNFGTLPPRILLALAPPVVAIALLARAGWVAELLRVTPEGWLIGVQSFRIVMEIILWLLFIYNLFPEHLTFSGRNYDVVAGLSAPIVAYLCFVRGVAPRWAAVAWNFLALGLLFNIVIRALLSAPTPFRVFFEEPSNTIVATVPFIWLPAFVVPFALLMHVLSLRQLLTQPRRKGV